MRPEDPLHHPIVSRTAKYENIVLRVSVKKKHLDAAGGDVKRALELANGEYSVAPAYIAETTFRFREMADFQYVARESPFVQRFRESVLAAELPEIKKFERELAEGADGAGVASDLMPPPRFSAFHYPYNYEFRQNPAVAVIEDPEGGGPRLVNTMLPAKLDSIQVAWDAPTPEGPRAELAPPTAEQASCIEVLRELFARRPLWSRRGIEAGVGSGLKYSLKYALPHVAYYFKTGPYRGAYVRYGVDPRSSPEFRFYQNEQFRIAGGDDRVKREPTASASASASAGANGAGSGYGFDGERLPPGGLLQLCDITEPTLERLIQSARVRDTFDFNDGWFDAQDMYQLRRLIRLMITELRAGRRATQTQIDEIIADKRPPPPAFAQYQPPPQAQDADDTADVPHAEEERIIDRLTDDAGSVPERLQDLLGFVKQLDLPSQQRTVPPAANGHNDAMDVDEDDDPDDDDNDDTTLM